MKPSVWNWSRLILFGGAVVAASLPILFLNLSTPSDRRALRKKSGLSDSSAPHIGCYKVDGFGYRGGARTTLDGKVCQDWGLQEPNPHKYTDPELRKEFGLDSNFCRNPSSISAPWCYLAEEPGFGFCDVPQCRDPNLKVTVDAELLAQGKGQSEHSFRCPKTYELDTAGARAMRKYNNLATKAIYNAEETPLHYFSFYGKTTGKQWDELVRAHVRPLNLQKGMSVFESGMGAGAFLDSLARQFGVTVAGVDIAQDLISIARKRIKGMFCAAAGWDLSFIPSNTYDIALSFAVFMYIQNPMVACLVAREMVRIVRPGGYVFLGQINDPEMQPFKPKGPEGSWGIPLYYWYRFAHELDVEVEVWRGEEVYSRRVIPMLDHYDLHAGLRYNVYLRKKSPKGPVDPEVGVHSKMRKHSCQAFRSAAYEERITESGQSCVLPFKVCHGECQDSATAGFFVDSCTTLGQSREWCSVRRPVPDSPADHSRDGLTLKKRKWDYCQPLERFRNETD